MAVNLDNYIPVNARIEQFYQKFQGGRILTSIVEHDLETGFILFRAEAYRAADDVMPAATGHAYEVKDSNHVNRTSHIEACETSAVGRALAILGFEVSKSVASREEMQKVERMSNDAAPREMFAAPAPAKDAPLCNCDPPRAAVWKSGVSKAGNAYAGYFCDLGKSGCGFKEFAK